MMGRLYIEKGGMWEEVSEEELRERLTGPTSVQLEAKLYETSVDMERKIAYLASQLQQVGAKCDTLAKRLEEALNIDVSDLI